MNPASLLCTVVLCTLLAVAVPSVHAEEIALLGGGGYSPQSGSGSFSWELAYRHPVTSHLSLGISYVNEGHFVAHHRDNYALQIWGSLPLSAHTELSAGVGPDIFFDTVPILDTPDYRNEHGVKVLSSIAATWYSDRDWFLRIQGNYHAMGPSIDTLSVLVGAGYRFAPSPTHGQRPSSLEIPENELTLLAGQTIANSFDSQRSVSAEIEYRHRFASHLEGSVAFLYEGDSRLIRRDGFIAELWATESVLQNRLSLGLGGGGYVSIESYDRLMADRLSGIVTLSASYRFNPPWSVRVSWNRIVTDYDRDSDVLLAGIGYLF